MPVLFELLFGTHRLRKGKFTYPYYYLKLQYFLKGYIMNRLVDFKYPTELGILPPDN